MIDLTPLEVRKKKGDFRRTMRGYEPALVDDFLDLVADRLDELVRENMALNERLARQDEHVTDYRERERALTEALVTAQEMREEMRQQTAREAELVRRSAEQETAELRSRVEREVAELRAKAARETERLRSDAEREVAALRSSVRQQREREEEAVRQLRARQQQFLGSYRAFLERELNELAVIARTLGPESAASDEPLADAFAQPGPNVEAAPVPGAGGLAAFGFGVALSAEPAPADYTDSTFGSRAEPPLDTGLDEAAGLATAGAESAPAQPLEAEPSEPEPFEAEPFEPEPYRDAGATPAVPEWTGGLTDPFGDSAPAPADRYAGPGAEPATEPDTEADTEPDTEPGAGLEAGSGAGRGIEPGAVAGIEPGGVDTASGWEEEWAELDAEPLPLLGEPEPGSERTRALEADAEGQSTEPELFGLLAEDTTGDGVPGPVGLPAGSDDTTAGSWSFVDDADPWASFGVAPTDPADAGDVLEMPTGEAEASDDDDDDDDEETSLLLRNAAAAGYRVPEPDELDELAGELLLDEPLTPPAQDEPAADAPDPWLGDLLEDER
jgi:cell division initiation protein